MSPEGSFFVETADFDKKFEALIHSVSHEIAAKGLYDGGAALLDAADNEIPQTPQKSGDLRDSRLVKDPVITENQISVDAGYTKEYAAYQHEGERKDGSHKVKEYTTDIVPNPGAKFLEKKLAGNAKRFMAVVADYIREKLGGSPR